jgi:hypothetical protein
MLCSTVLIAGTEWVNARTAVVISSFGCAAPYVVQSAFTSHKPGSAWFSGIHQVRPHLVGTIDAAVVE